MSILYNNNNVPSLSYSAAVAEIFVTNMSTDSVILAYNINVNTLPGTNFLLIFQNIEAELLVSLLGCIKNVPGSTNVNANVVALYNGYLQSLKSFSSLNPINPVTGPTPVQVEKLLLLLTNNVYALLVGVDNIFADLTNPLPTNEQVYIISSIYIKIFNTLSLFFTTKSQLPCGTSTTLTPSNLLSKLIICIQSELLNNQSTKYCNLILSLNKLISYILNNLAPSFIVDLEDIRNLNVSSIFVCNVISLFNTFVSYTSCSECSTTYAALIAYLQSYLNSLNCGTSTCNSVLSCTSKSSCNNCNGYNSVKNFK